MPTPTLRTTAPLPSTLATPIGLVDSAIETDENDNPLEMAFLEAARSRSEVRLDVVFALDEGTSSLSSGRIVLLQFTSGKPGASRPPLTFTVDIPSVVAEVDPAARLFRLMGAFRVLSDGDRSYSLLTTETEPEGLQRPLGPDDEQRCTALSSNPEGVDVEAAIRQLVSDPSTRDQLRAQWASSPAVWWAIQTTAVVLSHPEPYEGDFITAACSRFWYPGEEEHGLPPEGVGD